MDNIGDKISDNFRKHYREKFLHYGATSEGVDWGDKADRMLLRYSNMLSLLPSNPDSAPTFLDVGCGYGGLLDYANNQGLELKYTGIDMVHEMIQLAKQNHPEASFIIGNIFDFFADDRFDYVVCNGLLTQKLSISNIDMDNYANSMIKYLFNLANNGLAFNLMTTKVNFFSNNLYYRSPTDMFAWCMSELTPHLRIDHASPWFDYTVYLYKKPLPNLE